MALDSEMTPEKAIEKMKELRGPRAVQTVKVCSLINSSIILRIFLANSGTCIRLMTHMSISVLSEHLSSFIIPLSNILPESFDRCRF